MQQGCFEWSNEWSVKVEHKGNRGALSGVNEWSVKVEHKGNRGALGGVMSGVLRWSTRATGVLRVE